MNYDDGCCCCCWAQDLDYSLCVGCESDFALFWLCTPWSKFEIIRSLEFQATICSAYLVAG